MLETISTAKSAPTPGGMRELLIIALPMMASSACDTVMTFTDRLFLSKLGSAQMNAAFAGGLMSFMLSTFFIGLIGYATALVAQYYGSGQKSKCPIVITQACILAIIAYPLILLISPLVRMAMRFSGISPEQLGLQVTYFNILVYAAVVGLLRCALSCFFSGIGRTRVVMASSVTAMIVNVFANYVLIFGKLGFPAMGIVGAAYGTIVGGVCGLAVLAAAYFFGHTTMQYQIGTSFRLDTDVMRRLVRYGSPAGLEFFLNLTAFTAMISLFHAQGQVVATAATITFNWDMVAYIPLIGIEIAVTSLVGRHMGAVRPDIAHSATMSGIKAGSIYSAAMFVSCIAFPAQLVGVFRPEVHDGVFAEALPLSLFMVQTMALYVWMEAVMAGLCGALRGAGDTFWAMCISVTLHWLMVGLLYVMFYVLNFSAQIAWVALIVWIMLFAYVFYLRYRGGKWREMRVIDQPKEALTVPD